MLLYPLYYSIFIPVGHRNFFPSVSDQRFNISIKKNTTSIVFHKPNKTRIFAHKKIKLTNLKSEKLRIFSYYSKIDHIEETEL